VDRGQRDGVLVVGEDIAHLKTECAAREGREGFSHQVLDWKCHFNPPAYRRDRTIIVAA
jgi:hypothetical protein